MSLTNMGLDDLASFDASDPGADKMLSSPPQSPITPSYNPVGLTIGQTTAGSLLESPTRSLISSDTGSYGRNQSHSNKAVHMHVQENAKVPLLNQAIDRTNSSRPLYPASGVSPPDSSNATAYSMAELFLSKESKNRQSLNLNYERVGSLLDESGLGLGIRRPSADAADKTVAKLEASTNNTAEDEAQMEIDELTAAIDPTPWSEIERKIKGGQKQDVAPVPAPSAPHPHQYNYYPYGRQHQLPIPDMRIQSPPKQPVPAPQNIPATGPSSPQMAQAVATAAALASVGPSPNPVSQAPVPPQAAPAPQNIPSASTPATMSAPPYTKAQQTTYKVPATVSKYNRQRANHAKPQHAVAHTTSRASVLAAANKKSQYGFGGNHTVPSVPAPPPMATTSARTKVPPPRAVAPPPSTMPRLPNLPHEPVTNNAGAAYERKKQRAKDARVKLNEAIERLSIAMSLAGSQSNQRISLLRDRISKTEQRSKTIAINEECVKLTEQAKKWDRPSFVGTAASLIEALNSQCESLSKELVCLQEKLDTKESSHTTAQESIPMPSSESEDKTQGAKRSEHPTTDTPESPHKRPRAEQDPSGGSEHQPPAQVPQDKQIIFGKVAYMLDPISLLRCTCVSRGWRGMKVFESDDIWLKLAVKRFGFFNVRQWTERLADTEMDGKEIDKHALYRAMDTANVMPHFQQEGLCLLGHTRKMGRISGWAFMVERSNGETLRSVKREPDSSAGGRYQSRPVVELRLLIQNTGSANHPIVIRNQPISVDVSTRRSGGELNEISWDDRFNKSVKNLDGSDYKGHFVDGTSKYDIEGELCRLSLFEAAIIKVFIFAKGCSTTSRFQQRSNFSKILV